VPTVPASPTPPPPKAAKWLSDFEYQANEDWEAQLAALTDTQRRLVLTITLCSGGHWAGDLASTIRWVTAHFGEA
jgi:hypothetical protein